MDHSCTVEIHIERSQGYNLPLIFAMYWCMQVTHQKLQNHDIHVMLYMISILFYLMPSPLMTIHIYFIAIDLYYVLNIRTDEYAIQRVLSRVPIESELILILLSSDPFKKAHRILWCMQQGISRNPVMLLYWSCLYWLSYLYSVCTRWAVHVYVIVYRALTTEEQYFILI